MPNPRGVTNWHRTYHRDGADRACPWRLGVADGTKEQLVAWIAGGPGYPDHARCAGTCCMLSEGCAQLNGVAIPAGG